MRAPTLPPSRRRSSSSGPRPRHLDVRLSTGPDGYSTVCLLRASTAVPVIMLTAADTLEELLEGFNPGAGAYIVKPFSMTELLARVQPSCCERIAPFARPTDERHGVAPRDPGTETVDAWLALFAERMIPVAAVPPATPGGPAAGQEAVVLAGLEQFCVSSDGNGLTAVQKDNLIRGPKGRKPMRDNQQRALGRHLLQRVGERCFVQGVEV
jgi:CheY-like chemotaxis protein